MSVIPSFLFQILLHVRHSEGHSRLGRPSQTLGPKGISEGGEKYYRGWGIISVCPREIQAGSQIPQGLSWRHMPCMHACIESEHPQCKIYNGK